jgi:hypothetical protein
MNEILNGRYRTLNEIGSGAQATVLLCEDINDTKTYDNRKSFFVLFFV